MDEENRPNELTVSELWIVRRMQNLAACDTFDEDSDEPTQREHFVFGFLTEDEAMSFYNKGKNSLKFASCAGDYFTHPTILKLGIDGKRTMIVDCVCEKGGYYRIYVPATKEICHRCDGEGTHVNPNIDGNGLTAEDFAEDPDFRESYMSGVYDVRCEECNGEKIVKVPNVDFLPSNIREDYERYEKEVRDSDAEDAAEKRYFARFEP